MEILKIPVITIKKFCIVIALFSLPVFKLTLTKPTGVGLPLQVRNYLISIVHSSKWPRKDPG